MLSRFAHLRRRRHACRGALALVAVLTVGLGLATQAQATPQFLSPINVSDPGEDGYDPQVVVDSSGNSLTVWTRAQGATTRIAARFRAADGTFSATQSISDLGTSAREPQVAIDPAGNAIAVWTRFDGTVDRVQAAYRPAGAASTFGTPQTISAAGINSSTPQISLDDNGKAIAVWVRFDNTTNSTIQAAVRQPGGATAFGAATNLSVSNPNTYQPQVDTGPSADDNGAVVWTGWDGSKLRVQSSRRRDVVGYVRPKGATPMLVSLVPAYGACSSTNRQHTIAPAVGSCNPPARSSSVLTTGTADANSFPANMAASARLDVDVGDETNAVDDADVKLAVSISDVRNNPAGSDYVGNVLVRSDLRITDRNNAVETPETGTVVDIPLQYPATCVTSTDTTIGSSCSASTTLDSLLPNAVVEGMRSIWEVGQIEVRDAGPNGTGYGAGCPPTCGDGDETTFLRQGIFLP
jgi:hypothetical protein